MNRLKNIHFRRGWWKTLIAVILCLGVLVGAGFGIASVFKPDQLDSLLDNKTLSPTIYRVGGLDSNGNYMNTDKSIYTKDAFECQGLNCTLNFDNEVTYQIYFYDQNNEFVHTTGKLTGSYNSSDILVYAKYARIVITPKDDNKVSYLEVIKYAKQLKTTVYREQGFKNYTDNLFVPQYTSGYNFSAMNGYVVAENGTVVISKSIPFDSSYSSLLALKYPESATPVVLAFNGSTFLGFYVIPADSYTSLSTGYHFKSIDLNHVVLRKAGIESSSTGSGAVVEIDWNNVTSLRVCLLTGSSQGVQLFAR